jgi:hypothetical protein
MQIKIKIILVTINIGIFMIACINNANNNMQGNSTSDTIKPENMKCKIIITNYYFGRKQYITTVTQDSLQTRKDNMNGKVSNESRALTKNESKDLCMFLAKFPLAGLKNQYVTETVEDETVIDFSITINDQHKEINVANMYQKDLGALMEIIVTFLKEDYIGYDLNSVPYKE